MTHSRDPAITIELMLLRRRRHMLNPAKEISDAKYLLSMTFFRNPASSFDRAGAGILQSYP